MKGASLTACNPNSALQGIALDYPTTNLVVEGELICDDIYYFGETPENPFVCSPGCPSSEQVALAIVTGEEEH